MDNMENLRRAQLLELDLLKKFKEICEKEHITYYLLGGTAIGAVRHQGFIPWDDDIDVALLRDDYDKFILVSGKYLEPGQKVLHYSIDESYQDYTMKLVNANASYLTQRENSVVKQNIWIDIFPLDGAPNNPIVRFLHFRKLDFIKLLLGFHYIDRVRINKDRSVLKKMAIAFGKKLPIGRLVNPTREKKKMDVEFKKYSVSKSSMIGNYMGAYGAKEFFPKDYFDKGCKVVFEGGEYTAPRELTKYLTHQYGDYMKLPPVEQQIPKHNIIDIVFETSV